MTDGGFEQLIVGPGFMNEASLAGSHQKSIGDVVEHFRMTRAGGAATGPRPSRSYSEVSVVYACVRARSDALSGLPLMVSTADDEVLESGPLVDLAERPNEKMTGRQFRRHTAAYLDLLGRVHWWLRLDGAGRPLEVVPINPLQMMPKRDQRTGELLAWKYRPAGRLSSLEITLTPDEVHTIVDPDFESDDPLEGLRPRKAAAGAIAQVWKADLANEASLDNGVEPSGVFTMEGQPQDDQVEDVRRQIDERHAGVRNRTFQRRVRGLKVFKTGASHGRLVGVLHGHRRHRGRRAPRHPRRSAGRAGSRHRPRRGRTRPVGEHGGGGGRCAARGRRDR